MGRVTWNDGLLDRLRQRADPDVDEMVDRYYARHPEITDARHLVRRIAHGGFRDEDEELARYLIDETALPPWADPTLIAAGQRFFGEYSSEIGNILNCASLPEAYGAAHGVHVLTVTAELVTNTRRRAMETGHFLLAALGEGALDKGARGYRAARGVRLMHSAVRHMVKHDPDVRRDDDPAVEHRGCVAYTPRWSSAWGEPINQEDLLGTLLTFTWRVFEALDIIGLPATREQKTAYLHTWCVIGHLLGIEAGLLPLNITAADELHALLWRRLQAKSCAGRMMAAALVDYLEETMPGPDTLPPSQIRAYIGARPANRLGIPRSGWPTLLFGPMRTLHRFERATGLSKVTRPLLRGPRRRVWERLIAEGHGTRPPYEVSDSTLRRLRRRLRRGRRTTRDRR